MEPGAPLVEVETSWDRGRPLPQLVARDRKAERHQLEELAEACLQFSPHVSLESAADITRPGGCQSFPQALLLHTRHLAPSRDSSQGLLHTVQEYFASRGYQVRLAHAATPGAAWALAHYSDLSTSSPACIPTRFVRLELPAGAWWAPPPETFTALAPLPVEALRIPSQAANLLHQLGITRIGQLRQLPRSELTLRFGPGLCRQLDYALGEQPELLPYCRSTGSSLHRQVLESPLADRRDLQQVLEHLLQRLLASLSGSNRGIVQLSCRFLGEGGTQEFPLTLYLPSVDFEHLVGLLQGHMERHSFPSPVIQVEIEATMTALLGQYQQHLFPPAGEDLSPDHRPLPAQLGRLLDRLCCRLETGSVLHPRLRFEAQPEHCWEHSSPLRSARLSRRPLPPGTIRPLLLLPHPRRLSLSGSLPGGFPSHFDDGRQHYRVAHHWGPERMETGWWRQVTVRRDYYRVEIASGHRFWIYQDLSRGTWFLHGMFA